MIKKLITNPWTHVVFLMLLLLMLVLTSSINASQSNLIYQEFIEKLAQGQVDFSVPGLHGADFLALPIYWLTHSPSTSHILDIILSILCVPIFYLLGQQIFKKRRAGIFLAYAYVLMPLEWLDAFYSGRHIAFVFFFILGFYLILKKSFWSWLAMGISYIIKPYAIFACPLFLYKKQYKKFFLSLIVPAVYLFFQINQIGRLMVGAHTYETPATFLNLKNTALNLVYAIQNIFSVHNYSPFSQVYLSDMSHISVILVVLAGLAIFNYQKYFPDRKLFYLMLASGCLGLLGPCLFEFLDMWRIIVFYVMTIILALPILFEYKFFIPLSVGISGFHFFYSYLFFQNTFWPTGNKFIFVIWGVIFIISIIYYMMTKKLYIQSSS